jgi:replicative DNA helicase
MTLVANIFDYADNAPASINTAVEVAINAKKAVEGAQTLKQIQKDLENGEFSDEAILTYREKLADLVSIFESVKDKDVKAVHSAEGWFDQYLKDTEARRNGKQFKFGNRVFDAMIQEGPTPGDGTIICSSTGQGKTTLVTNLLDGFIRQSVPCIMVSSEMSLTAMMDRYLAMKMEVPFKSIVNAQGEEFDDLRDQMESYRDVFQDATTFRFTANPNPSLHDLEKIVKKFQQETGKTYCVLFIDLLSMVREFNQSQEGANFAQQTEVAMNKLNAMAKLLGIHYIGTVQLNRNVEADRCKTWADVLEKTKPFRSGIKNSGAYLERARATIALWRPKAMAKSFNIPLAEYEEKSDVVHFLTLKANNNDIMEEKAFFDGERFIIDFERETGVGDE